MKSSKRYEFNKSIILSGSNCDIVGHDIENGLPGYDFKGTVFRVCPRPWCQQVYENTAVDDLSAEEFDDLMESIRSLSEYD